MRFSDFKASYPDFQETYRSYFHDAKFKTILRRDTDFEARKLHLISVRHLGKNSHLRPERRTQLVQSLLSGDFDNAQSILQDQKSKMISFFAGLFTSPSRVFNPSPGDGGSLKREMKNIAARTSDSDFLLELMGVDDEVLQPMIQEIELLSYSLLSSIIDTTAGTMARAAVTMQHEVFRSNLQHEIESREQRLQSEALVEFIRKLNTLSARRRDWYVVSDLSYRSDGVETALVLCILMASPPRRWMGGEIRECADLVKVRVNDIVLFVLGIVIVSAGHGIVVILTVA